MATERIPEERRRDLFLAEIEALLRRVDNMLTIDHRPPDEILGYDENGLPH